ncbi:MAG TPA: AbrB/MazE/SpoVT family DNA-binding domain-containing protein [Stenomitos sp.]
MTTQKIALWGNSLGVRLPHAIAQQIGLKAGSLVTISTDGDKIVLSAAPPKYTLKQLLNSAKPEQQHDEVDWGEPVGDEAW